MRNLRLLICWLNSLSAALDSGSLRRCLKNPQGNNSLDLAHTVVRLLQKRTKRRKTASKLTLGAAQMRRLIKRSKTQERQGAREQPEGVYYGVNDRGLPQRNEVFRSGFFVLPADLAL